MAKKKNTIPSGFDDILGNIYSNAEQGEGITNIDDLQSLVEEEIEDNDVPPVNNNPEDGDKEDPAPAVDPNAHEDNSPEPPVDNNTEPPVVDNNQPPVDNQ